MCIGELVYLWFGVYRVYIGVNTSGEIYDCNTHTHTQHTCDACDVLDGIGEQHEVHVGVRFVVFRQCRVQDTG